MWAYLGVILVIWVFWIFLRGLGKRLPILEFILLIAGLQWIIGPLIDYNTPISHFKYYMYVDQLTYMQYVVPAYFVFAIVLIRGVNKKYKIAWWSINDLVQFSSYGIFIFSAGVVFDIIRPLVPNSLQFVFYLLTNFKFVGALLLLFSPIKWHRYLFYGSLGYLFFSSLRNAMFHDFILWSAFFYMFWAYKVKPSWKLSLLILLSGFLFGTVIQAVKSEYRSIIWGGYHGNYLVLFTEIMERKISGGLIESDQDENELNVRLNQGWIISAVMHHTPKSQPYANGGTVKEAFMASLVPRFIFPDKKIAGGVENFEKFTGISLSANTSMGLSIMGEAYANFGVKGGIIFMGFWGIFLVWIWRILINKTQSTLMLIVFLPLIFLQVVKAETELVVVLNHLIKSILLVFLFFWFIRRVLKWQLKVTQ